MFVPKWILVVVAVIAIAAFGYSWWAQSSIIGKKGEDEGNFASNDFPVIIRTAGGFLEAATIRHRRTFNLTNVFTFLGKKVPICKEKASVTVDTYITYRVRLAKRWAAELENGQLYVTAPRLEPSLPVAFDTSTFSAEIDKCALAPGLDSQNDLMRSISARLKKDAFDPERIAYAMDNGLKGGARETVREYVQKWLVRQKGYNIPPDTPIEVSFEGE
jgi:hypothetical protein